MWKIRKNRNKEPYKIKNLNQEGYLKVRFCKKYFKAHRIVWALHYGEVPPPIIDHINGIKTDNRIDNLRAVSNRDNCANQLKHRQGSLIGAYKEGKSWRSKIFYKGVSLYLGRFKTQIEANAAYLKFKEENIVDEK